MTGSIGFSWVTRFWKPMLCVRSMVLWSSEVCRPWDCLRKTTRILKSSLLF